MRHYNSQQGADIGLGAGWSSNLHKQIKVVEPTAVKIRRDDGKAEPFFCDGTQCTGDPDSDLILVQAGSDYLLTLPDGAEEHYDANGRLTQEVDTFGNATTYAYDVDGNLQSVTGPFGHQAIFTYQDGRVATMTDPAGRLYTYSYANDTLSQVLYPDGTMRAYGYADSIYPHHLTSITDEDGHVFATFTYDDQGRAISSAHAVTDNGSPQERFTFQYDSDTQTTVTDARGTSEQWTFEERLNVKYPASRTNLVDQKEDSRTYDGNGNLISLTDEEGRVTKHTYNATNQRISTTEAFGTPEARTTTFQYLSPDVDLVTEMTSPSVFASGEKKTITTYGTRNEVLSTTIQGFRPDGTPVSRTTQFTYYDPAVDGVQFIAGKLKQVDRPRTDVSDVTTFEYYDCATGAECGQLKRKINAVGHVETFDTYDAQGRVTQMTGPNGLITLMQCDVRDRLASVTQKSSPSDPGRTTTFTYTPSGLLQSTTTPEGNVLTRSYDAAHDLKRIEDSLGNYMTFRYDLNGNRITEETFDPLDQIARSVEFDYDIRDRLAATRSPHVVSGGTVTEESVTQFGNDAVGNVTESTDPNGVVTSNSYDALDRLTRSIAGLGTAAESATETGYDVNDRATRIAVGSVSGGSFQALVETTFEYDDLGNRLVEDSPDRGVIQSAYDEAGNETVRVDARGVTATLQYDALNRLQSVQYPDPSKDVLFVYDVGPNGIGRLGRIEDESGSTDLDYDAFGNLVSETRTIQGTPYVTAYAYDTDDRLTNITYPSGKQVSYTRDAAGRIVSASVTIDGITQTLASGISYRPFGPADGLGFGSGMTLVRGFDRAYRLSDQSAGTVQDLAFSYDRAGNITAIADGLDVSRDQGFGYDALDRLIQADGVYGARDYSYDLNGNRLTHGVDTATDSYAYAPGSNRLSDITGANPRSFTYDASGNTLTRDPLSFSYDDTNRMTEAFASGLLVGAYVYNARGERVVKQANGETTHFHYDASGRLIAESDASGNTLREYVYLQGEPLALIESGPEALSEVAVDAVTSTASNQATLSWSHPVGTGSDRLLLVQVTSKQTYVESVTYAGTPLTLLNVEPNADKARVEVWYLIAPPSGTADVVVNVASGDKVTAGALSFTGVAPGAPFGAWTAATGMSATPTVTGVPAAAGDLVVDVVAASLGAKVLTPGGTRPGLWTENIEPADENVGGGGSALAVAAESGVSLAWDLDKVREWAMGAVALKPAPIPESGGAEVYYYHTDHLGTPRALTDETQGVVWRADMTPFGTVLETVNQVANPLRFPGQYFDQETGLHYNYSRDYDPSIGRYTQSDPIGLAGGINSYSYVSNNPLNFTDRFGLSELDCMNLSGDALFKCLLEDKFGPSDEFIIKIVTSVGRDIVCSASCAIVGELAFLVGRTALEQTAERIAQQGVQRILKDGVYFVRVVGPHATLVGGVRCALKCIKGTACVISPLNIG